MIKVDSCNSQEGGLGCRGSTEGARDFSMWSMLGFPVPAASSHSLIPFFWGIAELVTLSWPSVWMLAFDELLACRGRPPASRLRYEINQKEMDGSNKMVVKSLQNLLKNNCKTTTLTNSLWPWMESSTVYCTDYRRGFIQNKFKLLLFLVNFLSELLKMLFKVLICSFNLW